MKKFFIGCLAVIGAIAIVSVGIAIISSISDSSENGGTTTTTPPTTLTSVHEELSTSEIVNRISPAVAHIIGDYSEGTGIVVDEKGYILTNNHVVEKEDYVIVLLPDREQVIAEIVYRDQYLDLAIIKCPGTNYPYVSLGSIEEPSLGDDVIVIGFPLGSLLGESASMSKGIISAFRTIEEVEYIQTDAPANPGNSGGPLINTYGEVIGIVSWGIAETEGINFAVEVNSIRAYIDDIVQQLIDGQLFILNTTTQPPTQTTPVVTGTPTPTTPVITEPPKEGEVELIEAQNEGIIELGAYGSDNMGWIELVINSLSDDLLHVTILPGTIFESQPAGAQSSMVVLKPREILVVPHEVLGPVSIETASLNMNLNVPDLGDSLVVSPDLATGNLMKLIELPDFQEEYSSIQQLAIWTLMDNPGLNEYPDAVPSAQEIDKIRSLFIEAGIPTEGYLALKPPVYVELIEAKRMGLIEVNATGTGSIDHIKISLTSNSDDILEITILPGTIFTSPAAGIQSMVVVAQEMVKRVFPHQTIEPFDVAAACASMELDAPEASNSLTLSTEAPPEDLIKLLGLPDFYEEDFRVRQFAIWTITDNPERDGYMGIATGFAIFGTGPSDEEIEKIRALFIDAGIATDKYKALS